MPDRIIRESICTSDTLNQLSDFEERFWHRLIVNCDDYGRFDARPAILKGRLFPLMEGKTLRNMSDALHKLASVGLVELYEVEGKPFLRVVTWDKYQRIRAKRSKFPEPDGNCCQMPSNVAVIQSESESNPNPNANNMDGLSNRIDYPSVMEKFNRICTTLPRVKQLTDNRRRAIRSAWKIVEPVGGWEKLFRIVDTSDFLSGRNGAWNGCGFDWILKPSNLTKIIEGNYANKEKEHADHGDRDSGTAGSRETDKPKYGTIL